MTSNINVWSTSTAKNASRNFVETNSFRRTLGNHPKLCRNCALPQDFYIRKSGGISVFYAMIFTKWEPTPIQIFLPNFMRFEQPLFELSLLIFYLLIYLYIYLFIYLFVSLKTYKNIQKWPLNDIIIKWKVRNSEFQTRKH